MEGKKDVTMLIADMVFAGFCASLWLSSGSTGLYERNPPRGLP